MNSAGGPVSPADDAKSREGRAASPTGRTAGPARGAGGDGTSDAAVRPDDPDSVRVDVWLFSVRLARTRSAASATVRAGHVRVNGKAVKAAQPVRVGDDVRIRRPGREHVYVVRRILTRRVGAPIARTAYEDRTPQPAPQLLARPPRREPGAGRPTKKERREMDRLRGRG